MKNYLLIMVLTVFSSIAVGVQVNDKSPSFLIETLTGQQVSVVKNKPLTKPIYLKFWATWCSYCIEEMPHFQHMNDAYKDDMEFVAVNVGMNDSLARINKFIQGNQYSMPVSFDEKGDLVSAFNIIGTPQHIIIGTDGKIIHRSFLITDDLEQKVAAAIAIGEG